MDYQLEEIDYCQQEEIGFENEYVYDVEVDDNTHTFIANDILVHNSNYVSFEELFYTTNYKETAYKDKEVQLILDIYKYRLEKYLNDCLSKFAKDRNTENYQVFELEKIGYSGIWVGKKKYTIDTAWAAPNSFYEPLSKITYTGIEIIQSSTPEFIRGELQPIVKYLLATEDVNIKELVVLLKELKKKYIAEKDFDKKCKSIKINDYEKYCINDKTGIEFALKCPINVRSAITYNYYLNRSIYGEKYENIGSGEKIKFYYSKGESDVFAYVPNNYPYEFAPEIDYDVMFDKTVLSPINTFLEAMGKQTISPTLEYKRAIF